MSHRVMAISRQSLMRKGLSGMHIFKNGQRCPHPGNCHCANLELSENAHWATFLEDMTNRLMPYFVHAFGNTDDAEDAVMETFFRFFRSIDKFRLDQELPPYIWKIAKNVRNDFLKAQSRINDVPIDDEFNARLININPHRDIDARMNFMELAQKARLSEVQIKIIYLNIFGKLPPRDIAYVLDCSSKVVRNELSRARKKIKAILEHS